MKENINVLTTFSSIVKTYRQYVQESMKDSFFSPNEIDLMLFLANNKIDTAVEFVKETGISKSLAARSADSLAEQGYLAKQSDKKDKRFIHLRLTEKGEEIASNLRTLRSTFFMKLTNEISEEEFLNFEYTLKKLKKNIQN